MSGCSGCPYGSRPNSLSDYCDSCRSEPHVGFGGFTDNYLGVDFLSEEDRDEYVRRYGDEPRDDSRGTSWYTAASRTSRSSRRSPGAYSRLEYRDARIKANAERGIWFTGERFEDMSDEHIANSIALCERKGYDAYVGALGAEQRRRAVEGSRRIMRLEEAGPS